MVLDEAENQFYLEIANPLLKKEGEKNSPRLRFKVYIPDKYFEEIIHIVLPNVVGKTPKGKAIEEFQVYSIEIKRKMKNIMFTSRMTLKPLVLNWHGVKKSHPIGWRELM